jgi:hypothetical protein
MLGGERRHGSRVIEVAAEWPLAVHGLAGNKGGRDQLTMVRNPDGNSDNIDVWLGHELLVI